MEPVLTLLAGYWIFRGLAALAKEEDVLERERELESKPATPPTPSPASPAQFVVPTIKRNSMRQPTAARYADAKSLFGSEYVSFTRLDTFAKCPHKFKLSYLEGFRQEDQDQPQQAAAGNEFHSFCENLFERYKNRMLGVALDDPEVSRDLRIRKVLEVAPPESIILASELELRFRARGREYLGYVDLAIELPDSTVALIDFKTGYKNPQYPPDPIQMDIYSLPELLLRPTRSVKLAFVLVDAGRTVSWTNGPANREQVIERVRNRIMCVERETLFAPRPSGLCNFCHVQDLCDQQEESVFKKFARRG